MEKKGILIFGHNDATQFIDIYNQYAKLFDRSQYEITVVLLTGKENDVTKARILADKLIFLNMSKRAIRGLKIGAMCKMFRLCKKKQFSIVICHRYKPTYIMLWLAQFIPVPTLIFVMHELGTMRSAARRFLIKRLFQNNMLFAGVSNTVRNDMQNDLSFIPHEHIVTLYNMIDVEQTEQQLLTREVARQQLNLAYDDFLFGTIARLAPNKDQKTLLMAFASILTTCPNAKLILIGDGILQHELQTLARKLQINQAIYFTGFIAQGFRYLKAFDCFVLTSIQEAFGRVLLEAMVAKLPIIATQVHGIPEVVGDTAMLVPAGDVANLAKRMLTIYNASISQREQYAKLGYIRARDYFSIPAFQEQFFQLPLLQKTN